MTPTRRFAHCVRPLVHCSVFFAFCAVILALPATAHAASIYVALTGSDLAPANGSLAQPYATVQKAIDQAHSGDTVRVGAGVFHGNVRMRPGVSLRGAGAGQTTLWGSGSFAVVTAEDPNAGDVLSGFTITGGNSPTAGGVYCTNGGPVTITGNYIIGNISSGNGGGIHSINCAATITGNTIINNSAADTGGGIYMVGSAGSISGNNIVGNTAGTVGGGGIGCAGCSPLISGNRIEGNSVTGTGSFGGGINCQAPCTSLITRNTVTDNQSFYSGGGVGSGDAVRIVDNVISNNRATTGVGGGIASSGATLTVLGNTVTGNQAAAQGGGLSADRLSSANNVVAGNRAGGNGGGIYCVWGESITNDTITGNSAAGLDGGGIYSFPAQARVTNCILWGNSAQLSPTYDNTYGCDVTYSNVTTGGVMGVGCVYTDPQLVSPASGDYRLAEGSPCIDAATATAAPATDKSGIARPWGPRDDMGAYEYYVRRFATRTRLYGLSSVRVWTTLRLTGTVSAAGSPYTPPGYVTITRTRLVSGRWRSAGSATVRVRSGRFSYNFRPTVRGSWRIVAKYRGGVVGPTTYLTSKSAVKTVSVR